MTSLIYKSEDWQLWTYQPQPGSFVLDFSQLNGPDVLGDGSDGLAVSQYGVAEVSIISGGDMEFGVIHSLIPTTATITVNVKDFTADVINDFFVGTAVLLTVNNPTGFANSYTNMFAGIIESANVSVIPGADFSTITISAESVSANVLNTDVGLTKDETTEKASLISSAANAIGTYLTLDASAYNFKGTARESKTLGDWLTDLALCDFMQMRDTPTPQILYNNPFIDPSEWVMTFSDRVQLAITKSSGTSVGTLDQTAITDLELGWSGAGSPTGVTLTNYTDNTIVYQYGSTGSGAGGSVTYTATVDVKNLTQMTQIGQQLLAMVKAFRPIRVTTITARTYQEVEYQNTPVFGFPDPATIPLYPVNFYQIGDTVTIDLPDFGIDNVDMIVVGRNIEVTPDDWTTSYTLWKGFTN